MQNVLQISKRIDYALRAMVYLAGAPPDRSVPFRKIAAECRLPQDFLGKIMKSLADKGLVRSYRGSAGGYRLARPAGLISFLDVVEAVEGPVNLSPCVGDPQSCAESERCRILDVWRHAQISVVDVLRTTSIESAAYSKEERNAAASFSR